MQLLNRLFHFVETLPPSDRLLFKTVVSVSFVLLVVVGASWSKHTMISVPEKGGSLTEGVIGTPRFINPLLAATSADKDMVSLLYSGLMRLGPDGVLVPDMAESVTPSSDGLTYNVILKNNLQFHDGSPVTTDDVIFTISHAQDPALKSPLKGRWQGVTMERISDREMNFVLSQPYTPFLESLTIGILPHVIWDTATVDEIPFSQHNSEPIGSGPYTIKSITRNRSGIPESYTLIPFKKYYGHIPFIEKLTIMFFSNEDSLGNALLAHKIDSAADLSPALIGKVMEKPAAKEYYTLYRTPLPRTFVLFFNQNENPALRDDAVREALSIAVDRERIVREVLGGYGHPIDGPLPPGFGFDNTYTATTTSNLARLDTARDILRNGGWKINDTTGLWEKKSGADTLQLKFSISTINTASFEGTAELLQNTWSELGVAVDVKKFEQSDFTQSVIRPRKYDALLFGTAVGRELDFYSFWHSSQRSDPGLNVALYANAVTDSILGDARANMDPDSRNASYLKFADEIRTDIPALFLYVPEFTYIAPHTIQDISFTGLASPNERFSRIGEWYKNTESIWPRFFRIQ